MLPLSSGELRIKWQQFREENKHVHLPEASLIADKESTALFNVAGMQQLIPFLVGKEHSLGKRLYNIQKCVRTNDIDDIGDERHLSLFEMMGNRSLGDYFKKESITRTIQFLHKELKIPLDRIGVTVFAGDKKQAIPRDEESIAIATNLGITHIKEMGFDDKGNSDNFWTPGPIGPCGPCAEFYYDRGESYGPSDRDMGVNDRYTEIWNNVFMAYYSDGSGKLTELPQKNVDTGMGFERLLLVLQDKETVFDTDLFKPYLDIIAKYTNTTYTKHTRLHRIVADHTRTASALVIAGLKPSNEGRGYVVRRIIRRMYRSIFLLNKNIDIENFINDMTQHVLGWLGIEKDESINKIVLAEILAFQKTLSNGLRVLEDIIAKGGQKKQINGQDTFKLYDTFGFPLELTQEIVQEKGRTVDIGGFQEALNKQQNRSRAATKDKFSLDVDRSAHIQGLPTTQFIGYDNLQSEEIKLLKDFIINDQRVLIFDKTPFYAEGGGQTGDRGAIVLDSGEEIYITDVKKYEGIFLHIAQ